MSSPSGRFFLARNGTRGRPGALYPVMTWVRCRLSDPPRRPVGPDSPVVAATWVRASLRRAPARAEEPLPPQETWLLPSFDLPDRWTTPIHESSAPRTLLAPFDWTQDIATPPTPDLGC